MPELAEVEYYRKKWDLGLGDEILKVVINTNAPVFNKNKGLPSKKILEGRIFQASRTHGKQMLFCLSQGGWISLHLGMTGKLKTLPLDQQREKHDHLALIQEQRQLIFTDPRGFGRVNWGSDGDEMGIPPWWKQLPKEVLSSDFNKNLVKKICQRHSKTTIKALLLKQEYFPGIGNWMADEILWQVKIHPARKTNTLSELEIKELWKAVRKISRIALRIIGVNWGDLPDSWLFNHRWKSEGSCPRDSTALMREEIGGRTSCYCATCQRLDSHLDQNL